MIQKFEVELLDEAFDFLSSLDLKARQKILRNMNRAKFHTDPNLFKKLDEEIWEFRTLYRGIQYRMLAFWDKGDKSATIVLATHGIIKKKSKVNKSEIIKAKRIREQYFKNKQQ